MAKPGRVFNSLKRAKLLRKQFPGGEALAGAACLLALFVSGLWIAAQKDAFDPRERDVSIETLRASSVVDTLYKTPLERWRDPALGPTDAAAATLDVAPFPAGVISTGWSPGGRVETFDPENLYEKINGQAEQYLKFGFERLDVLTLDHRGGAAFDLFLYDQASFANCLGLYQEQRGDKPVERSGQVLFTPTALGAYGMVGRVFFQLIGTTPDEPVPSKTAQLIAQLDALASAEPTPTPFAVFLELEIALDRIGYTPVNVFQYGFAERFWFARLEDDPTPQVFLHEAADAAEARQLTQRLLREQEQEYAPAGEFLEHRFLKTFFSVAQAGSLVYGVSDYPTPAAARAALDRLIAAFPGGAQPMPIPAPPADEAPADDLPADDAEGESEGGEPDYAGEEGEY